MFVQIHIYTQGQYLHIVDVLVWTYTMFVHNYTVCMYTVCTYMYTYTGPVFTYKLSGGSSQHVRSVHQSTSIRRSKTCQVFHLLLFILCFYYVINVRHKTKCFSCFFFFSDAAFWEIWISVRFQFFQLKTYGFVI